MVVEAAVGRHGRFESLMAGRSLGRGCSGSSEVGQRLPAEVSFCGICQCLEEVCPLSETGGVIFELPLMLCALGPWSVVERAVESWLLQALVDGVGVSSPGELVMSQ